MEVWKTHHASDLLNISSCEAIAILDYLHMSRGKIEEVKNEIKDKFAVRLKNTITVIDYGINNIEV